MFEKLLIISAIILIIIIGITNYLMTINHNADSLKRTASWNEALAILNNGEVKEVFQSHSLNVTLILKNGTNINTIEPAIDHIFEEVRKCGNICNKIILSTE